MQCPRPECGAQNHRSADRCRECGADLFAVPRSNRRELGLFFIVLGGLVFVFMSVAEQRAATGHLYLGAGGRGGAAIVFILYLSFGKWLPAIVAWSAGVVSLLRAWRDRAPERAARRHAGSTRDDQRPEGVLPASVPAVYRRFDFSLVLLFAITLALTSLGVAPVLTAGRHATAATAVSFCVFILLAPLVLAVKPSVARRRPGQSVEDYWSTPEIRVRVFLVWFLIAVAGAILAVTYFFTGALVAAVATVNTIAVFWLSGPGDFATEE